MSKQLAEILKPIFEYPSNSTGRLRAESRIFETATLCLNLLQLTNIRQVSSILNNRYKKLTSSSDEMPLVYRAFILKVYCCSILINFNYEVLISF